MNALTPETRLSQVLETIPGALDYVVGLNPHDFERLRHPMLRRYMSSRISLQRIAIMVGQPAERLIQDLSRIAHGEGVEPPQTPGEARRIEPERVPRWLDGIDAAAIPWVDVVPIDAVSGDPFPPISLAVKQLPPGGVLGIRHRWQPQPLYDVWSKMGLEWFAQPIGEDEWYIFVHRPSDVRAYPSKPVIAAEVGKIPEPEVLPRLQVLAEQLEPGQSIEALGLSETRIPVVKQALRALLGPAYRVETAATDQHKPVVRVTHLAA